MMLKKSLLLGTVLVLGLYGRSNAKIIKYEPPPLQPGVLASVTLSPTHSIDFVEYEEGVTAIIERRAAGKDPQKIGPENGRSLAEAFKVVRPGKPVPEALLKADERTAKQDKDSSRDDEPRAANHAGMLSPTAEGSTVPPPETPGNPRGNWTDWTSDAQWFLQNFCNTGQYRWCPTNINGWAFSGAKYNTTWFQATGFAEGFNSTALFTVKYRSCSGWGPFYSCKWKEPANNGHFVIQPRQLVTVTWTSPGSRWAGIENSSDRVALSVLWNTAGTPTGPVSTPGSCNDPGEFCCPSEGGGAGFYCNGGLECSAGICVTP